MVPDPIHQYLYTFVLPGRAHTLKRTFVYFCEKFLSFSLSFLHTRASVSRSAIVTFQVPTIYTMNHTSLTIPQDVVAPG
jgi:hypothetical protein